MQNSIHWGQHIEVSTLIFTAVFSDAPRNRELLSLPLEFKRGGKWPGTRLIITETQYSHV